MVQMIKRDRIKALDILRGFFLTVILVDHLVLFPSPFELLSGRGQLWASAAEGFFLISGLLVGYVYTPRLQNSVKTAAYRMYRRAGMLYVWAVGLTWIMVWWGNRLASPEAMVGLWLKPPLAEFFVKTLTLQYSFGWADFLRYYAVFMLFALPVLWLCMRNMIRFVLAISVCVWLLAGQNFFLAWQLLFVIGIVTGYSLPQLQERYRKLPVISKRSLAYGVGGLTLATIIASVLTERVAPYFIRTFSITHQAPGWVTSAMQWLYDAHLGLAPLIDKQSLGALRLLVALVWFVAFFAIARRYEHTIDRWTFGIVRTIGERTLLAYAAQALIVFGILNVVDLPVGIVSNTVVTAMCIGLIYVITRCYQPLGRLVKRTAYAGIRRLKRRHLVLVIGVACIITGAAYIGTLYGSATDDARQGQDIALLQSTHPKNPKSLNAGHIVAHAQQAQPRGEVIRNVPYCDGEQMDIYQPRQQKFSSAPVVMYLHGGGWTLNDKASEEDQLALVDGLRDDGYAIASIDYRLVPQGYYPDAVDESLCAVRFLRASAGKYNFDPGRQAVYGFSAGGYLAAMVGVAANNPDFMTSEYSSYSSRVGAVVTLAGLFDFTDGISQENSANIDQFLHGADPVKAEPTTYVGADDPPFLLVHGAQDQYVSLQQDETFAGLLEQHNVPVERQVVEHAEHGLNPVGGEMSPNRDATSALIHEFIRSKLESEKPTD